MNILGISGYYHDSAAALVLDGELIAAARKNALAGLKAMKNSPHLQLRFAWNKVGSILMQSI